MMADDVDDAALGLQLVLASRLLSLIGLVTLASSYRALSDAVRGQEPCLPCISAL